MRNPILTERLTSLVFVTVSFAGEMTEMIDGCNDRPHAWSSGQARADPPGQGPKRPGDGALAHVVEGAAGTCAAPPGPHTGLLVDALERLEARRLKQLQAGLRGLVPELRRTDTKAAGKILLGE
jgi:hypothetical protein